MLWYICIIITALVIYTVLLYGSNIYGANRSSSLSPTPRKLLYSLSFTVYGSGWIYLGLTETTNTQMWSFIPLFLGPILVFVFFHRVLVKILVISQQENVTSVPDFIAKRYGNCKPLAIIVTLLCLTAFIPYITLQLKAIEALMAILLEQKASYSFSLENYLILSILLFLGFLVVVIAGRQGSISDGQYKSLLFTSTVGALLKLVGFISVAGLACYMLYSGIEYQGTVIDLMSGLNLFKEDFLVNRLNPPELILQTIIIMMAIVCITYLFQTGITKAQKPKDLDTARWIFSLYLLIMAACVLPIIILGSLSYANTGHGYWLIDIPIHQSANLLILLITLGGFSATVGSTIVCCFALSRMIANHVFFSNPLLSSPGVSINHLQNFRYLSIILILSLTTACYLCISPTNTLSDIGWISFAGIVQLSPAMVGALYWKSANKQGVLSGLMVGIGIWCYTLLLPLLLQHDITTFSANTLLAWLQYLLPFNLSYITFCSVLALVVNFIIFAFWSLISKKRVTEHWQATKFINQNINIDDNSTLVVKLEDLIALTARFIGERNTLELFENFARKQQIPFDLASNADPEWIYYTEHLLAERLGSSTARAMVKSAIEGHEMQMEDVLLIVDEASEVLRFNRSLLQGALEHITQGISVIDKSLHLVAWNQPYIDLFDYPEGLIQIGRPIGDIIYYNAKRGMCGSKTPEEAVVTRLKWLSFGTPHKSERVFPNGRVIEIIGNPMPGGGFVTSFSDITVYRKAEQTLQEMNEHLELRVHNRTKELSKLNTALIKSKSTAEQANESKTRFLAAVSHDLMQPLNAARLFASSLTQEHLPATAKELIQHLESSLHSAEELISDLLDISRLESGRITPKNETIALNDLFTILKNELTPLAPDDITFKVHPCSLFIRSDSKLLRRIIQNFLTNAFRYGQGRVVLGARRLGDKVRVEVWDQGPGIPEDKQQMIFEEFKRLDSHQTRAEKGLGLGLAIADGFCKLLNHPINVRSWLGKGSVFSVTVPIEETPLMLDTAQIDAILEPVTKKPKASSVTILCVDNEDTILTGMKTLLSRWDCIVKTARNQEECEQVLAEGFKPQLLLIDYHLDHGHIGTDLIKWIREQLADPELPAIIISADNTQELAEELQAADLDFIKKPIKPAQLRALISLHVPLK